MIRAGALGFILVVVISLVTYAIIMSTARWRERKTFERQKQAYLKAHPLHSGSEPIVWICGCSHNDYEHDEHGCKRGGCYCKITAREVRDRY